MPGENLDLLAQDIADDLVINEGVERPKAFDPATIMLIIQAIIFLINLFKKKAPNASIKEAQNHIKRLTLIERVLVKVKLKKYLKATSDHYDIYEEHKDQLLRSTLRKISSTDTQKLEEAIMNAPKVSEAYL